jgi:hypothetical protein
LTTEGDHKFGECFACRVKGGVLFGFRGGGGYGREMFHSQTNAEFLRENDGPGTIPAKR